MPSDAHKPYKQFHYWFDAVGEPVLLVSGSGVVLAANKSFLRFSGLAEMLGKRLSRFTSAPPEAVNHYVEACSTSLEPIEGSLILQDHRGKLLSFRCEGTLLASHPRPAGRRVLLRLFSPTRSAPPPAGEAVARAVRDRDIENQLRTRLEQLAATEAQVRSVIETIVDGVITIDENGIILSANQATERIFGYTVDELFGQNVSILMPEPYRTQHDRYVANYLRTGRAKVIGIGREIMAQRKDGSQFPVYLAISEFRTDGRRYFTGVVRDVTERKRSENVAHFLADASRSLGMVLDYASTLQKIAYLAVPFFAEWCTVHMVQDDGSLIQLAAAHIDPDKSALAQEIGSRSPLAPDSPAGPAHILKTGKPELIAEVSGSLIESVAPDPEHRIVLRELGLDSYMGVPLRLRGKVFGIISFYSADPQRKYDSIDLAVAEDLANRAATAIENSLLYRELRDADRRKDEFLAMLSHELRTPLAPIQSGLDFLNVRGVEPDVVSAMQQPVGHLVRLADDLLDISRIVRDKGELRREPIHLPVQQPAPSEPVPEASSPPPPGRRILIVEDNVATARILAKVLSELGSHDVHMVHDGLSALEAAKKHLPQIVLLDIGLPRMNGYEVAQKLREQPEFRDTVLVALTGYGTEDDRRRSAEVGFDRHLVKPPSLENLQEVLAHPRLEST